MWDSPSIYILRLTSQITLRRTAQEYDECANSQGESLLRLTEKMDAPLVQMRDELQIAECTEVSFGEMQK